MAKGSSSLRNNKVRSSKPYDASNSFVKKVTSQVTNFLPQSEWFPFKRWFRTSQQSIESDGDDDDGVVDNPQPPPSKRAKISLNRTFPVNSFRVADDAQLRERRPQFESPSPVRHAYPDAVAGPSGLSTSARYSASSNLQSTMVTENLENKLNGDGGSDSSESTSGCSSLVPQASKQNQSETLAARRRTIDEKLNLTNHLQSPRSLFPNRVRTPRIVPPPSRRRPSFNASVFSSPLLESDRLPSKDLSPFYAGRTMYGGASAYRRPRESSFVNELNVSKRGIQVRPVNDSKNSPEASMSHTARRILEALEQFSTPVQDAKRMPLNCPLYRPPLGSKRKCVESEARPPPPPPLPSLLPRVGPPTQSLTVPTVADLIKLRCKEKLQDSMESARRIASSSAEPYSLRLGEERKCSRHPGKMMKSSRIEYEANDVNLPEVSLPITTMPKFDIMVPPVSTAASSAESSFFKFSSPITVTSALPNVTSQGTFTFSAPLNKGIGQAVVTQNFLPSCPSLLESVDSFKNKPKIVGKGLVPKSKGQSNSVGIDIKPASELKTGSVMDFFAQQKKEESGKDKNSVSASVGFGEAFKPASGTWECDACMIRNKADATVCLACETPRQAKAALIVKPSSAWTCTSCFVPNKDSDAACVCCTNPKPGTVPAKKSGAEPAGSSWNCEACGAVNSCASNSCSECWCNKPNNSSEPPKTSSQSVVAENKSTWTCSYCMTCNENENVSCKSCKKTKVGSKTSSSKIKFNFEIPAEASTFKFGVDNSGNPPTTVNNLGGFKFGETAVTASSVNFTFGVPSSSVVQSSDKQKDVTVTSASSSFAAVLAKGSQDGNTSKVGGFNFGTNQNQSSEVSNSSSRTSKRGSDSIDDANVKVPGTGSGAGPKRKADVPESVVNGIKSAQKRKAESAESVVTEVKSEQNEKPSSGLSKPFVINTNTNVSKPTTIPSIFSTAVSSSSLGAGTPAKTKTANSGGFSFVSSSTSGDKSTTTTTSMATSAPSFVFGSGASKTTELSVTKKPVSINSAPVTTATVVPSFGSCVTSSAGFGSNANTVSSGNATTSSTTTFGTISPKPVFGTAATTTTTTTPSFSTPTPTAKMSFTPPITTTPSFGVPDTTTPAFGTSATKPNSVTTTSATLTFGGSTVPSAAPLFGAAPAATAPNFGVSPATSSPSISSSSATAASFGTTATTALTFNATPVTTASPFGTTPATTVTGFGSSSTATPIFGSSAAATVPSFGATPATTASGFGATPATTVPAFGSASATVTPAFGTTSGTSSPFGATPTPSFGVTTTSTAPSFGSASTTSTPTFGTATSSFGSPAKPGSFGSASPVPSFGIPSTKTPAFGTTPVTHSFGTPTPTPSFGNSAVNAVNFNTTGTSAFGTPITTSTVGFGTPTITPSFGTPKTETNFAAPATTAPAFGTPTTTPSFGSGFGSTSTPFGGFSAGAAKGGASSPTPGTFVFKGNATPSIFGGSQTTSNNAECPPSKIPNFGFGTANTGSSNASAAAPSFGTFNFSAGSGAAPSVFGASAGGANATSGSVFGTGTTPAFGTSGGSSGFGSGGFNFTAGSSTGSQPFTFNNPQSNQNTTPAFGQVQQPQPQPAPPTFNPNVRPTFDFTRGETPQFTAQSSAPLVTTSRRIKKAVRRTVR